MNAHEQMFISKEFIQTFDQDENQTVNRTKTGVMIFSCKCKDFDFLPLI